MRKRACDKKQMRELSSKALMLPMAVVLISKMIDMPMVLRRAFLVLVVLATSLLTAHMAQAQEDPPPREYFKRLHSPATARGVIGGESHDSYVIHARKGQTMSVRISW